tara:strand:+ start:32 stop:778 length:747 start_codon:yes stop_codon:yes gene_type:complete
MALNTFTHTVLSAGLVSDPELALGSGYQATGSTSRVVSLTAGTPDYNSVAGVAPGENPIPAPGIGTVGHPTLSGTIGLDTLGAIGGHPVTQLLYNPPPTGSKPGTTGGCNDPVASPYATGTDLCKGYGNLNEVGGRSKVFTYRLVSPDSTETFSFHKPHLKHVGDTFVSSSLSGITVALRTGPAQAGKSKFVVHGDQHKGVEVQYYLGDPLGSAAAGNGLTLSAGLSSDDSGLAVGPEHARKRLLGFN